MGKNRKILRQVIYNVEHVEESTVEGSTGHHRCSCKTTERHYALCEKTCRGFSFIFSYTFELNSFGVFQDHEHTFITDGLIIIELFL